MASSNAAFTKKLRLAIKAKIQELGVDADDELPDYVMVLAANKKDKQLMRDDLQIFLGKSTAVFVDWLFDAFERIQKGIVPSKPPEPEKNLSDTIKTLPCDDGDALQKFERGRRHSTPEHEERKKKSKKKKDKRLTPEGFINTFQQIQSPKHKSKKRSRITLQSPSPTRKHTEKNHKKKRRTSPPVYNPDKHTLRYDDISDEDESEDIHIISEVESVDDGELVSSRPKFKPRLRSQLGCIVLNNSKNDNSPERANTHHRRHRKENDQYKDGDQQEKRDSPSKIFVNKDAAIFKRAISSANLNSQVAMNVEYMHKKEQESSDTRVLVETKETGVQVNPQGSVTDLREKKTSSKLKPIRKRRADNPLRTVARLMGMELNKIRKNKLEVDVKVKTPKASPKKETVSNPESSSSGAPSKTPSFSGWNGQITIDDSSSEDGEEAEIDAFVANAVQERHVLGAQLPPTAALSRPQLYASQKQTMELLLSQTTALQTEVVQPTPKVPINERCRFWPNCTKGTACPFIHPSQTCAKFPSCFYGNKCLYIHPLCKYSISCKRPNCPFTHVEGGLPQQKTIPAHVPKSQLMCKFKGQCEKPGCEFKHPPLCLYGMACKTYGCTFLHRKPDLSKFKWVNPKVS